MDEREKRISYNVCLLEYALPQVLCKTRHEPGCIPAFSGIISTESEVRVEVEEKTGAYTKIRADYIEPEKGHKSITLLVGHNKRRRRSLKDRYGQWLLNMGKRDHRIIGWSGEILERELPLEAREVIEGTIAQYNMFYSFRA